MPILANDGTFTNGKQWIPSPPNVGLSQIKSQKKSQEKNQEKNQESDQETASANCHYSSDENQIGCVILTVNDLESYKLHLDEPHILLEMPAFTDGRIFSLATMLRAAGYTNKLTVIGQMIPDQVSFAFRCGIDEVQFTNHDQAIRASKLVRPFTEPYQAV